MAEYEFTIIASGLDPEAEDFEQHFYDAGCDDATISFQKGHIIVDFAREAPSVDAAISSAITAVRAAGATVDRVEPDPLVSMNDIAHRAGRSRQSISLYAQGARREGFPAPVARVTSESPLWRWAAVANWLFRNRKITRKDLDFAVAVERANEGIAAQAETAAEDARKAG
ncbi:MAG TPA: hypothetical protein VIL84_10305 [Devosiaceae bacterium]